MEYIKHVSDYFGIQVDFPLDDEIHRFGKKKEFWVVGRQWNYKSNQYWQVKYGNFKQAVSDKDYRTFSSWEGNQLTKNESISIRKQTETINAKIELQKQEKYKTARDIWGPIFRSLPPESEKHPYIIHKGLDSNFSARISDISNSDIHLYPGTLCVPVYNVKGEIAGVQRIYEKNKTFEKRYCTGLELKGSICPIGRFRGAPLIYVCEGYATGASIHMATDLPVIVCFQASNILASIQTVRTINPECKIVICADRDLHPNDPISHQIGEKKAKFAASKTNNCIVRVVEFPQGSPDNWSDFNDAHQFAPNGLNFIKKQLEINLEKFEEEEFKKDIKRGFTEIDENEKTKRKYHRLLAFFQKKHHYRYISDQDRIVVWKDTHYEYVSDRWVKGFAQQYFNYPACESESQRAEFFNLVKSTNIVSDSFFSHENTKGLINLKNGVYDYENDKILSHDPKYHFQYVIPVDYDPNAICPIWDSLMQNVCCQRKHLQDVIEEFMGFAISDMEYDRFNKALILDGSGSNGKSTVIRAIKRLCGDKNCSSISMADIPNNRFLIASMVGKLINFSEEEPKKVFSESGYFKKLTGGSPLFAEDKGKKGFSVENRTKLILSYNEVPYLPDSSLGMKRRLLIVPFDLNLELKSESDKMISHVQEKLDREMSGILNRAIDGLKRLIDNKNFTDIPESTAKIDRMIRESDTVRDWFEECVIHTGREADKVSTNRLYESYLDHLGGNSKVKKPGLTKKIKKILEEKNLPYEKKPFRFGDCAATVQCFTHIALDNTL